MTRAAGKPGTVLVRGDDVPLYRQIYEHFRTAIAAVQLRPGDRMPSVRRLAEDFATARGTIDAAYAMLIGEGYVVSRGPAGTIVSPELGRPALAKAAARLPFADSTERRAVSGPRPSQIGLPSLDAFPRKVWSRVAARQVREFSAADMAYPDPAGFKPLRRQSLAEALFALFGDELEVDLKPGGMHLIVRFGDRIKLAKRAQSAGLAVEALSSRAITHSCGQGLLLGFTNVAATDAKDTCRRLKRAISSC